LLFSYISPVSDPIDYQGQQLSLSALPNKQLKRYYLDEAFAGLVTSVKIMLPNELTNSLPQLRKTRETGKPAASAPVRRATGKESRTVATTDKKVQPVVRQHANKSAGYDLAC
jgi:hypothetical protein